ncbi:MAG TPA: glycosyltransferase [Aeromicrobium sp.]|nr:glycosyltransferase [Aeromicrobium sp.]
MKVLSIIHYPVAGGPHNRVGIVSSLLQRHGIDTLVVLPAEADEAARRIRDRGVDVHQMPLHRLRTPRLVGRNAAWAASMPSEIRALARLIREREIDVVAVNALANPHAGIAARLAGAACVWELIDTFPPPAMRRAYMPMVLRLSDAILTTGVRVAELHPGTTDLGDRWLTFFPCVDVERFKPDPESRARARAELGLPSDVPVVGNVATISPMKGHATFIRAAARLRETNPDVRFVILGSRHADRDDYYDELWSLAGDLGLELGRDLIVQDPGPRVAELAPAFDLFWMTSEPNSEGIPTAIGEAKALGLPVVTTDVGSTSECVTEGVSGYVVPPNDPEAIAVATARILGDPVLATSMSEQARKESIAQFAADRGAQQHRRAYEVALEHHLSKRTSSSRRT